MNVDLQLIANRLQEAFSGHVAANGGITMTFFISTINKRSIAKRNLLDECLYSHTDQIITTLQIPAHM